MRRAAGEPALGFRIEERHRCVSTSGGTREQSGLDMIGHKTACNMVVICLQYASIQFYNHILGLGNAEICRPKQLHGFISEARMVSSELCGFEV